jgi:hypothetical protein
MPCWSSAIHCHPKRSGRLKRLLRCGSATSRCCRLNSLMRLRGFIVCGEDKTVLGTFRQLAPESPEGESRSRARDSTMKPRVHCGGLEKIAGVASGHGELVAQGDGFNEAIFEGRNPVLFLRSRVQAAPDHRRKLVIIQNPVMIIFEQIAQLARKAPVFFALREQFNSFDQFAYSDGAEAAFLMMQAEPSYNSGVRLCLRQFAHRVRIEQVFHSSRSREGARSVCTSRPERARRPSASVRRRRLGLTGRRTISPLLRLRTVKSLPGSSLWRSRSSPGMTTCPFTDRVVVMRKNVLPKREICQ